MKWHVYRYPQKLDSLMVLGSILTKPDDLESSLNYESGIKPFPAQKRLDQTPAVKRVIHTVLSEGHSGRMKVVPPTLFPAVSAGVGIGMRASEDIEATVEALGIKAEIVMPAAAKEYIDEALLTPKVSSYVRKGMFSRPLYLIVGVATCKQLVMGDSASREHAFSAEADVSLTAVGLDIGAGASAGKKTAAESGSEVQEECAFAYRVRKFRCSTFRRIIKEGDDDVAEGALFGRDGGNKNIPLTSEEAEAKYNEVPVLDGFESEDEEVDAVDGVNFEIVD